MKRAVVIPVLVATLGVAALVSLTQGRYPVSLSDLAHFLGAYFCGPMALSDRKLLIIKNLLIDIRLPRVVAAILVGASLSVSGAVFQSMFINPLVSPGLLGVLAGASFGAAVGMVLAKSGWVIQASAFGFGLVAVSAALVMSTLNRGERLLMLILGGIIGWVGLLIPHIARMLVGPDNRTLLPSSALIGATYLLIADNIARLLFSVEIPIGILTALVGIPFLAFVLRTTKPGS